MILLYLQHHFLQTVFLEKINASHLKDRLQAYNCAYNNTTHPSDEDAQAQFVQDCGPPPSEKKEDCRWTCR